MSDQTGDGLDPEAIRVLLRDAMPTRSDVEQEGAEETEARRRRAVLALLHHLHTVARVETPQPADREVVEFFRREGFAIFLCEDPGEAMDAFLGRRPQRVGRRRTAPERNESIVTAVLERIEAGSTVSGAFERQALSADEVRKIYYSAAGRRIARRIRADRAIKWIDRLPADAERKARLGTLEEWLATPLDKPQRAPRGGKKQGAKLGPK